MAGSGGKHREAGMPRLDYISIPRSRHENGDNVFRVGGPNLGWKRLPVGWPSVGGQEADSSDHDHAPSELKKAGRPIVAPGYFMFPIAPGKPGFLAGSMG